MTALQIPIVKAKASITINTDALPDAMYTYALFLGLKAILSRGTVDHKRENFPSAVAYEAAALEIANRQAADLLAGKTRQVGLKTVSSGKTTPDMVEAIRIAKIHAKSQAKAAGLKISAISAAEWTRTAKAYIDADPETWMAAAAESIARAAVKPKAGMDFMPKEDPELMAKAEAAKAKKKAESAAKAAGKAKPKAPLKAAKAKPAPSPKA
jgi:hypothetical protein